MINKKPWMLEFLRWCGNNNMSNVPDKVLTYMDQTIIDPFVKKQAILQTKIGDLEAKNRTLLIIIDDLTTKLGRKENFEKHKINLEIV